MRFAMHSVVVFCCLTAATGSASAQQPAAGDRSAEEAALPDGTIRKGTLANAKLIHDAHDGVFVKAVLMGMAKPAKEEMFVVQEPVGRVGAKCWREKWFLTDEKGALGKFEMLLLEDGSGGATWVLEDAAMVPGGVIARTGDGERAAAMPQLTPEALDAVVRADSKRYVDTAKTFVAHAIHGRVHDMIALTSPLTITVHGGLEDLHDTYAENYLPRFKNATIKWDEEHVLTTDETGNRGIRVSGFLKGKKQYRIELTVMREGGKHVIVGFTAKKPDSADPPQPDRS